MDGASAPAEAALSEALERYRRQLRTDLARELHDGPSRELTGAIARLEEFRAGSQDPRMQMAISIVEEHTRAALVALRRIMNDLRDEAVAEDLPETVAAFLRRYEKAFSVTFTLVVAPFWPRRLPVASGVHILRVVQEAVANAIRHGAARHIVIELKAPTGGLSVAVHDDGHGIRPGSLRSPGLGIQGMRERAALLGGGIRIVRRRTGTSVLLSVPGGSRREPG